MQLFVNQLTNVDFSYLDSNRGLVGETWLASALLDGALDDEGMICDFGIVKRVLRDWLDDEVDHRLLVPTLSPDLKLAIEGDRIRLSWHLKNAQFIEMDAPLQAVALVEADVINEATVADWCKEQLRDHFPVNVEQLQLSFETEVIDSPFYHYSHGLKKHSGNCQRIAHGHRSRIHIWLDDQPAPQLEQVWADKWQDIYLGLKEDIAQAHQHPDGDFIEFAYQANQGEFRLTLPQSACYILEQDTTVENLSAYLAQQIKAEHPDAKVKVQAFEGVNKGAISIL